MKLAMQVFSTVALCISVCAGTQVLAQQTTPSTSNAPVSHMKPVWKRFAYTCDGNKQLIVNMRGETIRVFYDGKTYNMKQTMSASGARYSDGSVVWWNKGEGGFLQTDGDNPNMIANNCTLVKNPGAKMASVSGTVTYLQRIAMPAGAGLTIELKDVSLADAPAPVIASEVITFGDKQVPIPYQLQYDPSKINPKHTYSMSAKIMVQGQLRFISDKSYPVITNGNPAKADLVLKMVTPTTTAPAN